MNKAIANFFYNDSKLFVWSFKRKRYELVRTPTRFYAVNNSRSTVSAVFMSFILVMWIVVITSLLLQQLESQSFDFTIIFVAIPGYIMGIIGLRQFLWLVNGRQELTIENGYLTLHKRGTFFTKEKTYNLNTISKIRANFFEEDLSTIEKMQENIRIARLTVTSQIIGAVLFTYKFDTIKVFNDLTSDEKKELIGEITKHQQNKTAPKMQ